MYTFTDSRGRVLALASTEGFLVASEFYAHSPADKATAPPEGWQLLEDHLRAVECLAEQMAWLTQALGT